MIHITGRSLSESGGSGVFAVEVGRLEPDDFAREHGDALLRLAVMLTGNRNDAQDLVQEVFARLLRNWPAIERSETPRAYARRAVVNTFLSQRRTAGRESVVEAVPDVGAREATGTGSPTDEAWRLLATLPPRQRAVLALRYYEGLPDAEIAQALSITSASVRSHAARGLATLRERVPSRKENVDA